MKELTNSNVKTRNETKLFIVVGKPKKQWRADGLTDVYSGYCCYKRHCDAKKWIEKNGTSCTDYIIIEQVAWIMGKNLNYLLGKSKKYWDC